MNTCSKQGLYLFGTLGELGWTNFRSFRISSDNRGALYLSANVNYSDRSKHIAIRFAALRSWIADIKIISGFLFF